MEKEQIRDIVVGMLKSLPDCDKQSYVLAMDNYLTVAGVIGDLHREKIGVVGTARARKGWPPREFKEVNVMRFNTIHYLDDNNGDFRVFWWIHNNVVTMVSSIHDVKEYILQQRNKPHENAINKDNIKAVFGDNYTAKIYIPGVIND